MDPFQSSGGMGAELLLIIGVVIQYIAARLALGAVLRGDESSPGRRALVQWLPIAATVLAAVALRQSSVAVALVFGSSVACLSLVMGLSSYVGPMAQPLPPGRRVWALVVPASILLLLAGFHGSLTWFHAIVLIVMGGAVLGVWTAPPSAAEHEFPFAKAAVPRHSPGPMILLAVCLAGVGAWAAVRGAEATAEHHRILSAELLAATVLSPLLLLPALGSATLAAQRGQMGQIVTSLCGTVILNLCALLPAIILIDYLAGGLAQWRTSHSLGAAFGANADPTPFPLVTWRVDAVVLLMLACILVPIAAGRWVPARFESMLLVLAYAIYELAHLVLTVRLMG